MRGTRDRDTVSLKNTCRCFFVGNIFSLMIDFVYSVLSSLTKREEEEEVFFGFALDVCMAGSGRVSVRGRIGMDLLDSCLLRGVCV